MADVKKLLKDMVTKTGKLQAPQPEALKKMAKTVEAARALSKTPRK